MSDDFSLVVHGEPVWDAETGNVDVEVTLSDNGRFGGTFFTLRSIEALFEKNAQTGECGFGTYLWAANMVIVKQLTLSAIRDGDVPRHVEIGAAVRMNYAAFSSRSTERSDTAS